MSSPGRGQPCHPGGKNTREMDHWTVSEVQANFSTENERALVFAPAGDFNGAKNLWSIPFWTLNPILTNLWTPKSTSGWFLGRPRKLSSSFTTCLND
ncbi:unnamed protein product [Toxocara canis]|uniref:Uncharacterized protein n=1 Tax=Toxocara canis TaxID=6265 RepID=A0A183UA82_TOXCA|nr:unnamed protein product [Toxocara canis]